ncbi:MAG: hypothetical protein NDJ65_06340 [Paludibacteraceae bacterium]|jgi:hypothetical protein|nr:hypothetical protein [Paludibacteraceae bacterium]MBR0498489.1 hypothetical protein [Paludibacteraceae bacterium]MCM8872883.1 hypothetical protein [Paludibacteraceae bacterium]
MRKLLFAFFALMFSAAASAQIETKIVGVWSVDSVTENKDLKLNNKETKDYSKLKKSEIIFTADHHAKFKLLFSGFNIADGYWYYNESKDVIVITKWNDRKVDRMRLWYDLLENDRIKFYIDETPFELYVSRKAE